MNLNINSNQGENFILLVLAIPILSSILVLYQSIGVPIFESPYEKLLLISFCVLLLTTTLICWEQHLMGFSGIELIHTVVWCFLIWPIGFVAWIYARKDFDKKDHSFFATFAAGIFIISNIASVYLINEKIASILK